MHTDGDECSADPFSFVCTCISWAYTWAWVYSWAWAFFRAESSDLSHMGIHPGMGVISVWALLWANTVSCFKEKNFCLLQFVYHFMLLRKELLSWFKDGLFNVQIECFIVVVIVMGRYDNCLEVKLAHQLQSLNKHLCSCSSNSALMLIYTPLCIVVVGLGDLLCYSAVSWVACVVYE